MKKTIIRLGYFTLVTGVILISILIFLPRSYDVPHLQKRDNTKYWNLTSGSVIAYTLVEAKENKKSFPIIFLQGGPGGAIYDNNIKILGLLAEDGYDVYLYDQVGSGFSNRLENISEYTADRHKKDLEEIIGLIGSEKVILIGQSWGAILATLLAAEHPDKIEKIIFTGPGPIQPTNKELANIKAPDSLNLKKQAFNNAQANQKAKNLRMNFVSFLAKRFRVKLASDSEADNFQTYLNSFLGKSTVCDTTNSPEPEAGGGFYAQLMTVNSFKEIINPRPKLQNSEIPILVMKGQCDNQNWGITNEYLDIFPNHQLVIIPGAGHSISIEQPEMYINTLREFLRY